MTQHGIRHLLGHLMVGGCSTRPTELASRMWHWVKPGGGVLWYDFTYDNPANAEVRGIGSRRIKELFPYGHYDFRRVTLAPPIARRICRLHVSMYGVFNMLPFLRTHLLCWIGKAG